MTNKARQATIRPTILLTNRKVSMAARLTPIIEDKETIFDKPRQAKKARTGRMKVNRNS